MYDAIVVGARCAGSPTAMLLARKGYRVLLVDRASFPSDSPRGHFVRHPGVKLLHNWGLLDRVAASNCTPARTVTLDWDSVSVTGTPPPADGIDARYAPRRRLLDKILVDAAVEAGAELREGFSVQELLAEDGRIVGITGRSHGGQPVGEKARIVIGADGLHSIVAKIVQAPVYEDRPPLSWGYFSYWSGVPSSGLEVYIRDGYTLIVFPTNDGLTCVAAQGRIEGFQRMRADIEGGMQGFIAGAPTLAERVFAGKREERFLGSADLPNFFRKPFGPGWALVGDAGYHKDPISAQGISDAFRDAELLSEAINAGLSGRQPLDEALAGYEQQRNEVAMPAFDSNYRQAYFNLPPRDQLVLQAALWGNQADSNLFMGTVEGTVPAGEFFAPSNIGRIMRAAAPTS